MNRSKSTGLLTALALSCGLAAAPARAAANARPTPSPTPAESGVRFEPNLGQLDGRVRFSARHAGRSVFLTGDGFTVAARGTSGATALRARFVGARAAAADPAGRLPGVSNYLSGGAAARAVPGYREVRFRGVYDGVDVRYYGRGDDLEYDVEIAPGADVSGVAIAFEGQEAVDALPDGDLVLRLGGGEARHLRPFAYQRIGGGAHPVAARYDVEPGGVVRLALGAYDRSRPLVVDPVLTFASYVGGEGNDEATGVGHDAEGSLYVAGWTEGFGYPTTPGALDAQPGGKPFLTKFAPDGKTLVYSTYVGGTDAYARAFALAVAPDGAAYLTGYVYTPNFAPAAVSFNRAFTGSQMAYVLKIAPDGASVVYSGYLGGAHGGQFGLAIAVGADGAAYVTGSTSSDDFPVSANALQPGFAGGRDAPFPSDSFVTKIAPDGGSIEYSTFLGGADVEYGYGIAVDAAGSAYVTGTTTSVDFPVVAGSYDTVSEFPIAAYVAKLSPDGSALVYSTNLGGTQEDEGRGIAVDETGAAYVTGSTNSQDFPTTPGAFDRTESSVDAFVAKLTPDGSALAYSTLLGTDGSDSAFGVAVDSAHRAYVVGTTTSSFPVTDDAYRPTPGFGESAFVVVLNAAASRPDYATYLGGNSQEHGAAISADDGGAAYVAGQNASTDFPATGFGSHAVTTAFVAKLETLGGPHVDTV
jgi:Tol biopolymer transport system component